MGGTGVGGVVRYVGAICWVACVGTVLGNGRGGLVAVMWLF